MQAAAASSSCKQQLQAAEAAVANSSRKQQLQTAVASSSRKQVASSSGKQQPQANGGPTTSPETQDTSKQWSLTQADAQWIVAQWLLSSLTQPELN